MYKITIKMSYLQKKCSGKGWFFFFLVCLLKKKMYRYTNKYVCKHMLCLIVSIVLSVSPSLEIFFFCFNFELVYNKQKKCINKQNNVFIYKINVEKNFFF